MTEATKLTVALPSVVALYCGAGGLDLGFNAAGFPHLLAIDGSRAAVRSWNHNLNSDVARSADLNEEAAIELVKSRAAGHDVGLVGGPPCQGFSRARSNGVEDDPRLRSPIRFVEICEAVAEVASVQFVMMENVDALLNQRHSALVSEVIGRLHDLGLQVHQRVLNASDFGVPQTRTRAFLLALAADRARLPEPLPAATGPTTVREAITDFPTPDFNTPGPAPVIGSFHANHVTSRPTSERFKTKSFNRWRSFRLLDWDSPSPTVAYGNREIHVHPDGTRRLSVYEAMCLQGFAKPHRLYGTFSEQVQQVSNAVPPPLAEAVARSIAAALSRTPEAVMT